MLLLGPFTGRSDAAPVTYYRIGSGSGFEGYASLASAPTGAASYSFEVPHDGATGTYLFQRGSGLEAWSSWRTRGGDGYATTSALTGTVPAGTWTFNALVRTDVPSGDASGVLIVAVHAASAGGSRLLTVHQGSTNVLAGPGDRSVSMSVALPDVSLSDERIVTEWWLAITSNEATGTHTTELRHGLSGDTVVFPGPPAPPPLQSPENARVTSVGDRTVSIAWDPSPDDRIVGYVVRRATSSTGPFSEVSGVVAETAFTDTGLTNGVRYFHDVVGVTADGTRSPASNATSAVPRDTEAPEPPTDLTLSPSASFQLTLDWGASPSADAAAYRVERSTAAGGPYQTIASDAVATSYTDRGLPSGSTWHYRVRTVDDDGHVSAATASASGTVPPSPPAGLFVRAVADGAVVLEWDESDEVVESYRLERATSSGGPYATVASGITGTSYTDTGLTNGTTYHYRLRAVSPSGIASSPSASVSATPRDTGRPAPVGSLTAVLSGSSVQLSWDRSVSSSVVGYRVFRLVDGANRGDVSGLISGRSYTDSGLKLGQRYTYEVVAEDASGNRSDPSTIEVILPPPTPTRLRATSVSEEAATLAWDGSDHPAVTYRLERSTDRGRTWSPVNDDPIQERHHTVTGLAIGTVYEFRVQAVSLSTAVSNWSDPVTVRPQNGPPTAPQGLVADGSGAGGQVLLTWTPNPESDVVRYEVQRAAAPSGPFQVVGLPTDPVFDDRVGLVDGRTYYYRVVAVDSVGLRSPPSATVSVVPTDTEPPSAPTPPAVFAFGDRVRLAWSSTTGATRYEVLRSTQPEGPYTVVTLTTAREFVDEDVVVGGTYHYRLAAFDAAGNRSPNSELRSATVSGSSALPGDGSSGGAPSPPPPPQPPGVSAPADEGDPVAQPTFPPVDAPDEPGGSDNDDPDPLALGGDDEETIALGEGQIPESLAAGEQPSGFARSVGRAASELAGNVPEVARTFSVPLAVVVLLLLYLALQNRIDRGALPSTADVPATGGDDDDVEYLL